jgi:hypothetical protein
MFYSRSKRRNGFMANDQDSAGLLSSIFPKDANPPKPYSRDPQQKIYQAIDRGDTTAIIEAITAGADVNFPKDPPLIHWAKNLPKPDLYGDIPQERIAVLDTLLQFKADPNIRVPSIYNEGEGEDNPLRNQARPDGYLKKAEWNIANEGGTALTILADNSYYKLIAHLAEISPTLPVPFDPNIRTTQTELRPLDAAVRLKPHLNAALTFEALLTFPGFDNNIIPENAMNDVVAQLAIAHNPTAARAYEEYKVKHPRPNAVATNGVNVSPDEITIITTTPTSGIEKNLEIKR